MDVNAARVLFIFAMWIAGLVFLSIGLVALKRGPKKGYIKLWVAYCFATALHLFMIPMSTLVDSPGTGELLSRFALSLGCIDQLLLVLYALSFSRPIRGEKIGRRVGTGVACTLVVLIMLTDLVISDVSEVSISRYAPVAGPIMPVYSLLVLTTWIVTIMLFARNFRRSEGLRRIQTMYMIVAVVIGLVGSFGALIPIMLDTPYFIAYLPMLLFPLFPLTITYATIRYRLMDIRTVMHRTAVWAVLTFALMIPLFVVFHALTWLAPSLSQLELLVVIVALFMLGYLYLDRVRPKLDHLFERGRYDRIRVIDGFARSMASLARPREVAGKLLTTLDETLYIEHAFVMFRLQGDEDWKLEHHRTRASVPPPTDLEVEEGLSKLLVAEGAALERGQVELDDRYVEVRRDALHLLDQTSTSVLLPLVQGDRLIGLVLLGSKRNLRPYSADDMEFLEQLASSVAVGLYNAELFERVDLQRQDLERSANELEDKVEERTAQLARVNVQLSDANEGLKTLDRLKSRFFAGISHELRTPLTLILLAVKPMLTGALGDFDRQQGEHLEDIRRNALALLKLINDLMDLSRLEESKLKLKVEDVDLVALAQGVMDISRPLAMRQQIEVTLEADERIVLEADGDKLERVLVNLLTNALKFTEAGGRVVLRVVKQDPDAVLSVEDSGIGIPEAEIEKVFDRFHQVESTADLVKGGTGIGLSLVKEFTELHGGSVSVRSREGEGSVFTVRIPIRVGGLAEGLLDRRVRQEPVDVLRREDDRGLNQWNDEILGSSEYRFLGLDASTERRVVPRQKPSGVKEARLLVVDDNADMLRHLYRILGERYDVMPVQDGERAWSLLREQTPDLVVSDVMMPGISGLELCRRIRTDPTTQGIPVILLTARGSTEHKIEGHEVSADEYIVKPFDAEELMAAVGGLLASRVMRAEVASRRHAESLENVLSGMAHELRNAAHQMKSAQAVISKVTTKAIQGGGSPQDLEQARSRIDKMDGVVSRSLERISRVVAGIGHFASGKMKDRWIQLDLDALIRREVEVLARPDDVTVEVELFLESNVLVTAPPEELRMTVINIVENAMKAVDTIGTVTVRSTRLSGRAVVTITDEGCGVAPENLERIFDPFFTTRDPGRGMGLGLSLARRTIEDMGGTISMKSQQGVGTEVILTVPFYESQSAGDFDAESSYSTNGQER